MSHPFRESESDLRHRRRHGNRRLLRLCHGSAARRPHHVDASISSCGSSCCRFKLVRFRRAHPSPRRVQRWRRGGGAAATGHRGPRRRRAGGSGTAQDVCLRRAPVRRPPTTRTAVPRPPLAGNGCCGCGCQGWQGRWGALTSAPRPAPPGKISAPRPAPPSAPGFARASPSPVDPLTYFDQG